MPRLDDCHPQIVRALEKDGWKVEPHAYKIETSERTIFIDVEASRQNNGSRQHVIVVEIKCFPDH